MELWQRERQDDQVRIGQLEQRAHSLIDLCGFLEHEFISSLANSLCNLSFASWKLMDLSVHALCRLPLEMAVPLSMAIVKTNGSERSCCHLQAFH